jgi:hypothetical protein
MALKTATERTKMQKKPLKVFIKNDKKMRLLRNEKYFYFCIE